MRHIRYIKKRGDVYRSRDLSMLRKRFLPYDIIEKMHKAYSKNERMRVLEIGCGEGRVLMEIRKLFSKAELYGLNKEYHPILSKNNDYAHTGVHYKIFTKEEIIGVKMPMLHIGDAGMLNFDKRYFDFVISQMAFPYIERKDKALENVWRVLKLNGMAFLNIDCYEHSYPDFLNYHTPRFIIYEAGKCFSLRKLLMEKIKTGHQIIYRQNGNPSDFQTNVIFVKNSNKPIHFNLSFDSVSSFNLNLINPKREESHPSFWGYRSVFHH